MRSQAGGEIMGQARMRSSQIKSASSIRVYGVAFQSDPAYPPDMAMLEYCASDPDFVYEADDAAELTRAYQDIARSLTDVRISRQSLHFQMNRLSNL